MNLDLHLYEKFVASVTDAINTNTILGLVCSPPCETYIGDLYRGCEGRDRYGKKEARRDMQEQIKQETCMQLRSAALCRLAVDQDVPFILHIPCCPAKEDEAARLDEVRALAEGPRTMKTYSHGSYYTISSVAIDSVRVPPPMLGPRFVQALLAVRDSSGVAPATDRLASFAEAHPVPDKSNPEFITDVVPRVLFHAPLKPHADIQRELENSRAYGGMRNPRRAVDRLGLAKCGHLVRDVIDTFIDERPHLTDDCVMAIGDDAHPGPNDGDVAELNARIKSALPEKASLPDQHPDVDAEMDAVLLEAWRVSAGDIDCHVAPWLRTGSPAGIDVDYDICGVFPETSKETEAFEPVFYTDDFENYESVDGDPASEAEIAKLMESGYFDVFDTISEVKAKLGADPIMGKLKMITKIISIEVTKRRIILGCLTSGGQRQISTARAYNTPQDHRCSDGRLEQAPCVQGWPVGAAAYPGFQGRLLSGALESHRAVLLRREVQDEVHRVEASRPRQQERPTGVGSCFCLGGQVGSEPLQL